jgi:hypothetical protein
MIRPLTCICFLMASGSGLYLYQSKHAAQVLDRTIEKTMHDADVVREQTRALRTEWTLLNEPERLRQLATLYLPTLKSVAPGQFTSLADLDGRLPPVRVISPLTFPDGQPGDPMHGEPIAGNLPTDAVAGVYPIPPVPPSQAFVIAANAAAAPVSGQGMAANGAAQARAAEPASARVAEQLPLRTTEPMVARVVERKLAASPRPIDARPADPRAVVLHASWSRPVDVRPAEQRSPEPRQADLRSMEARPLEIRPVEARPLEARPLETRPVEARPAETRSVEARATDARSGDLRPTAVAMSRPAHAAATAAIPPQGGSLLGMAHVSVSGPAQLPIPRPTPVNAWSSSTPTGG